MEGFFGEEDLGGRNIKEMPLDAVPEARETCRRKNSPAQEAGLRDEEAERQTSSTTHTPRFQTRPRLLHTHREPLAPAPALVQACPNILSCADCR